MSEQEAPPDSGGAEGSLLTANLFSTLQHTPASKQSALSGLFLGSLLEEQSPGGTGALAESLRKKAADMRDRELQERRRKTRAEHVGKVLRDITLPIFDQGDQIHVFAHVNNVGADPMDYL